MDNNTTECHELKMATSEREFDGILERLEECLPMSYMMYGALLLRRTNRNLLEATGTKIYYSSSFSLVVATPAFSEISIQNLCVFWNIDQDNKNEVTSLLKSLPDFDWTQPVFFYSTPTILLDRLRNFATDGVLGEGFLKPGRRTDCHLFVLTSQPEIKPRLPEGYELREVGEEYGEVMLNNWKRGFSERIENYKQMLKYYPGVGVFKVYEKDDVGRNGKLVAWTHINRFNNLTNTFTLPEHRCQQLGLAVTIAMARKSLQATGIAVVCITKDNPTSQRLHEKAGFKNLDSVGYQYFKSTYNNSCPNEVISPFN